MATLDDHRKHAGWVKIYFLLVDLDTEIVRIVMDLMDEESATQTTQDDIQELIAEVRLSSATGSLHPFFGTASYTAQTECEPLLSQALNAVTRAEKVTNLLRASAVVRSHRRRFEEQHFGESDSDK